MNEKFEDRLGRSLTEIVPERPPGDLAGAARTWARRTRRRRQGVVAGAAAVAVLAAIGIPWAVTRGGEPAGDPAERPELEPLVCPVKVDRGSLPGEPGKPLARGAVRAQLCPAGGSGTFQSPPDVLKAGLHDLVALVNAQPLHRSRFCPANLGTAWTVLLQYADGTVASVTGENYGCNDMFLGRHGVRSAQRRDGAGVVYKKYLDLLAAQRATREPPGVEVSLSCPSYNPDGPPFSQVPPDTAAPGLTRAQLCWKSETQTELPFQSAELDARLVELVNADLAERVTKKYPRGAECRDELRVELVAQNAWGDRMLIPGSGCGLFGTGEWFWRPGAEVQQRFEDLIESKPESEIPLPTAADQPDAVVRAWADVVNRGDRAKADSLWVVEPTLPSAGVTKIGFKDSAMGIVEPKAGTPAASYAHVWLMQGALYWEKPGNDVRDVDITIVRDSDAEPWRILSIVDRGQASVGR